MRLVRLILVAGCAAALLTGCAQLSLFSGSHVHYYGNEETGKRLAALEQRVRALEQAEASATETAPTGNDNAK
jgi:hypothetical protein